jgi:hypothetical protein
MKKLVFLFATACMMLSCDNTATDVAANPEMVALYQESLTLNTVAPDSVGRFTTKVNNYILANPSAKNDEHYHDIVANIQKASIGITVAGFEDVIVNYEQ